MMSNTIPANFLAPKATPLDYPMNNIGFNQQPITLPAQFPMAQPMQQPVQQAREDLYQVQGMDGAKRFQTRPNSRYALFDADDDVMYIKVTDQNNYPIQLQRFRFTPEEEPVPEVPQYVTMKEFAEFKEELLDGIKHLRTEGGTAQGSHGNAGSNGNINANKQPGK